MRGWAGASVNIELRGCVATGPERLSGLAVESTRFAV